MGTPNDDGELKIGLQQHHVAAIPRTALDIHLRGLYGAWPMIPIEIPADRLYLRWHKTDNPSFKPYVDLIHRYFYDPTKQSAPKQNMWGFRMESYGLLKSKRTIYKKQNDPTIYKQNRLPFLVDIQSQIISLSKALSFHYILSHHPRNHRRNRSIPNKLFSSNIFKSGWDGKTIQIQPNIKVIRMESKSNKEEKDEKKEE